MFFGCLSLLFFKAYINDIGEAGDCNSESGCSVSDFLIQNEHYSSVFIQCNTIMYEDFSMIIDKISQNDEEFEITGNRTIVKAQNNKVLQIQNLSVKIIDFVLESVCISCINSSLSLERIQFCSDSVIDVPRIESFESSVLLKDIYIYFNKNPILAFDETTAFISNLSIIDCSTSKSFFGFHKSNISIQGINMDRSNSYNIGIIRQSSLYVIDSEFKNIYSESPMFLIENSSFISSSVRYSSILSDSEVSIAHVENSNKIIFSECSFSSIVNRRINSFCFSFIKSVSIRFESIQMTLSLCSFLLLHDSTSIITSSSFMNNTVLHRGKPYFGIIEASLNSKLSIDSTIFSKNYYPLCQIHIVGSIVEVFGSLFIDNTQTIGGVLDCINSVCNIRLTTIVNNSSKYLYGSLYSSKSSVIIENSDIENNYSPTSHSLFIHNSSLLTIIDLYHHEFKSPIYASDHGTVIKSESKIPSLIIMNGAILITDFQFNFLYIAVLVLLVIFIFYRARYGSRFRNRYSK